MTHIVLGKLARRKVSVRSKNIMVLLYFENSPLIQLTRSVPLRDWPKFEVLLGVMVDNNSLWWIVGSKRGRNFSTKSRCYSR